MPDSWFEGLFETTSAASPMLWILSFAWEYLC
jgi:hypothetical protein